MLVPKNKAAEIILSYASKRRRSDLIKFLGMSQATFSARIKRPQEFKLYELAALQKYLLISDEDIIAIIKSI